MQLPVRGFGGFRLSPKPPTRWDEGSSCRCSRRMREAQSCQPISTAVQQYSLTPTASRKSAKTMKSTRLTTDGKKKDQKIPAEKKSGQKNRFRLAEPDCVRSGLRSFFFTHIFFPASGQAVVTGVAPSPPSVRAFIFYRA